MSKRRLSVLVDSNAREAARAAGLPLYEWTQRAIMRAAAAESFERFVRRLLLRPDNSHAWPHLLARVLYVPGMCAAIGQREWCNAGDRELTKALDDGALPDHWPTWAVKP